MRRYLLISSIVKPFYRENAGLLAFVYFIMFLAVGQANGVGLIEYHYSLIRGMLGDYSFLLAVHVVWLIYAMRCAQFVRTTFEKQEFFFLKLLALVDRRRLFILFLGTHILLSVPVLFYVLIIALVGFSDGFYLTTSVVLVSNVTISCVCAGLYLTCIQTRKETLPPARPIFKPRFYFNFLLRYLREEGKVMYLLIKIFSCGTLYLLLRERNPVNETDLRLPIFFYCTAVLTHSILIHRVKDLENCRLTFYRTFPVTLAERFANYAIFYFCLFVPEILTVLSLTPAHLTVADSVFFIFFGYGLLLMLNSLQLYNYTGLREYLKAVMQFFVVFALALIPGRYVEFSIIVCTLAVILFFTRYYRFEPYPNNVMR